MIVRKMRDDEIKQSIELDSVVFEQPLDLNKDAEEYIREFDTMLGGRPRVYWRERWAAYEDNDETMMSCMQVTPYPVRYNGHTVLMGGVGGVATLPPYRKQGAVRACFIESFRQTHQSGQIFSFLYPFSRSYYRKFGYESCIEVIKWTINLKALKPFNSQGSVYLYRPGEDISDFKAIYDDFTKQYDFSVVREDIDYHHILTLPTFKDKKYAYVWKNKEGVPKGYIIFNKEKEDGKAIMDCVRRFKSNDFCFSDAEGFMGLIDLVSTFSADYHAIRMVLPPNLNIGSMIPEGNEITRSVEYLGMLRVIDVEKVLQLSQYQGSGDIMLNISDQYCPWNNDTWAVRFENGKCVSVDRTTEPHHIEMDIAAFSALIGGAHESEDLCFMRNVHINRPTEAIDKIFFKKKSWIADFF